MKMRRAARKALAVPLMIGGAVLFLTIGTANVFAASSSVPVTSSGPHEHEFVVCSPNPIAAGQPCTITFTDAIHKGEPFKPTKVCFTVNPTTAGTITTGTGTCTHETLSGSNGIATGTFTSSANFCGNPHNNSAIITSIEPNEHNQKHHTTVTIACSTATTKRVPSFHRRHLLAARDWVAARRHRSGRRARGRLRAADPALARPSEARGPSA